MWQDGVVTATSTRPGLPLTDLVACCSPASGQVLGQTQAVRLAGVLKALAEPSRLRLVSLIATNASAGATCVCDLIGPVGLSQPTVSHHLKVLTDAGLLEREQRGKWAYYSLVPAALDAVATAITPSR
jgi:ArsR family transcriptional regulator